MAKKPRKIAVVGTARSSEHAPINDPSWEIWGVGYRGDHITRCDRWFEIHRLDALHDGPEWRPLLKKWAKDCELVMFWPEPLGPKVMQYPVEQIKTRYGTYFMTSSIAWMLALAIEEHATSPVAEIGIWGIDMEFGTEYREQRAGVKHFLGLARFAGIPTRLLANSGIVYEPVPYPFWQDDPLTQKLKLRREVAANEIAEKRHVLEASVSRLGQINTAVDELRRVKPSVNGRGYCQERAEKLEREAAALTRAEPDVRRSLAFYEGTLEEIDWQADYLKP